MKNHLSAAPSPLLLRLSSPHIILGQSETLSFPEVHLWLDVFFESSRGLVFFEEVLGHFIEKLGQRKFTYLTF